MTTSKETFGGSDSINNNERESTGLEKMVRREIAQQVADVLRNI